MEAELERAGKALPLLLAGLYVVGFLVVGIHLGRYGVSSFELLRVQYLAAGFWCMLPLAVFYTISAPLRALQASDLGLGLKVPGGDRRAPSGWQLASWALIRALFGDAVLLLGVLLFWRRGAWSLVSATYTGFSDHEVRFVVLVGFILLADLCWVVWRSLPRDSKVPTGFPPLVYWERLIELVGISAFACWVFGFSLGIYPRISFGFGGGEPRRVVFILSDASELLAPFLVRDGASQQTVPYRLLVEKDNSFVVVSPNDGQQAIEFERKAVSAMIVLGTLPKGVDRH